MTRLAITGHRGLPAETEKLVDKALRAEVDRHAQGGALVGLSCLADGADAMFARAVLDADGELVAIIPAAGYRDGLPAEHHQTYDELYSRAVDTIALGYKDSTSESHMAASERMLDEADHVLAVWDGQPARGYGGTADVVHAARERGVPVTVVWPHGSRRE
ncbi:MAG: hypothetical protein GEU98_17345 [Pseudonocardiaceae bacterium]|nr:hypothetical protein [Pseudonocardiaceae bacterium]